VEPIVDDISDTEVTDISPTRTKGTPDSNRVRTPRVVQTAFTGLGTLGLALPIGAYFWFIHQYSVNVLYWDQWADIDLLRHWYAGTLSLSDLWASHGDHRILFPNLIVLGLAQTTHFNVVFEEYLSGAMLVAATGLFISTHRRRSPSTPLIYYCPVALLLFSFVQFQNTLWGFQMAWYLVTLGLGLVLFLQDRPILTGWVFAGAIAAAVVASFSSLQGLLIWPVGFLLLYIRHRSSGFLLVWLASATIMFAAYFYHLDPSEYTNQTYVFAHPLEALKFFFFLIGSIVGVQITNSPWPVIFFGVVIFSVAIWVVAKYLRRDETSSRPIGVVLACYGILFAATVTQGRAWFTLWAPSRYSTCGLLVLAGCYFALLDRPSPLVARERPSNSLFSATIFSRLLNQPSTTREWSERRNAIGWRVVWTILAVAICVQVILGTGHGLVSAKSWSESQKVVADITVNIDRASNSLVQSELSQGSSTVSRQLTRTMKTRHLSLFATSAQAYYTKVGLLTELTDIHTRMLIPPNDATLKGTCVLVARASDMSGVTKVEYRLVDSATGRDTLIGAGKSTYYGWIGSWNTFGAANGTYELNSVAYGYAGKKSYSPTVRVTIANKP
jgi:hypothetical protein